MITALNSTGGNVRFKGLAIAASLPPVLFNAVIIGIAVSYTHLVPRQSGGRWNAFFRRLLGCPVEDVYKRQVLEYSEREVLSREKPKIYKPVCTGKPLRKLLQKN